MNNVVTQWRFSASFGYGCSGCSGVRSAIPV